MELPEMETVVVVRVPGVPDFKARRIIVHDGLTEWWAWASENEDEAPECWTDGVCWASNDAGEPSVKPTSWLST